MSTRGILQLRTQSVDRGASRMKGEETRNRTASRRRTERRCDRASPLSLGLSLPCERHILDGGDERRTPAEEVEAMADILICEQRTRRRCCRNPEVKRERPSAALLLHVCCAVVDVVVQVVEPSEMDAPDAVTWWLPLYLDVHPPESKSLAGQLSNLTIL